MGLRYSASISSPLTPISSGAAYAEMLAGATKSVSVTQVLVSTKSNIGGSVALVRAFAVGTGAATGIATAVNHRIGATSASRLQVAWTSSGVTPTGFNSKLRQAVLPVATGQVLELWGAADGPLVIEPSQSLLLVNHGSGISQPSGVELLSINFTWEEGPASDH